jgi:hypothetical protein
MLVNTGEKMNTENLEMENAHLPKIQTPKKRLYLKTEDGKLKDFDKETVGEYLFPCWMSKREKKLVMENLLTLLVIKHRMLEAFDYSVLDYFTKIESIVELDEAIPYEPTTELEKNEIEREVHAISKRRTELHPEIQSMKY